MKTAHLAQARNELTMEFLDRNMRRKTGLLMTADGKPEGRVSIMDKDNRAPPTRKSNYSEPMHFAPDDITGEVMVLSRGASAGISDD